MPFKSEGSNITVTFDGVDLTPYCTQSDLEGLVNEIDGTTLASAGAESAPGSTNWTLSCNGLLEKAVDDVMGKGVLDPPTTFKNLVVTAGPVDSRTTYTWTGTATEGAFVMSYNVQPTESTQLITWTGEIGISGGPVRS